MPHQNQSSKIGKSSSPVVQRVIENNKNAQQPVTSVSDAYNKKPVKQ